MASNPSLILNPSFSNQGWLYPEMDMGGRKTAADGGLCVSPNNIKNIVTIPAMSITITPESGFLSCLVDVFAICE